MAAPTSNLMPMIQVTPVRDVLWSLVWITVTLFCLYRKKIYIYTVTETPSTKIDGDFGSCHLALRRKPRIKALLSRSTLTHSYTLATLFHTYTLTHTALAADVPHALL